MSTVGSAGVDDLGTPIPYLDQSRPGIFPVHRCGLTCDLGKEQVIGKCAHLRLPLAGKHDAQMKD
jgi:hypothetical protein